MMPFQNWDQFSAWLDNKGLFHMELGLERMYAGLRTLDLENLPFARAQVLGTNGKGSTATFLAALAQSHGLKTGLYTSPHLVSPKERILINGRQVSDEQWLESANAIQTGAPGNLGLSYFEFLTLLALHIFSNAGVEVAIMEAGLGGKNDATSTIPADILCFTPIAMDHAAIIGPTLADIAHDKACAIRGPEPVVSAPQFPQAKKALQEAAKKQDAPIFFPDPLSEMPAKRLSGPHQRVNGGVALAAWRKIAEKYGITPKKELESAAFARAFIPGRMQHVPAAPEHHALLLDGAHNPHGMAALADYLQKNSIRPAALIFSCLADKDWQSGLGLLCRLLGNAPVFVVELANERACQGTSIASFCDSLTSAKARVFSGPGAMKEALAASAGLDAPAGPALVCGSFYLLAEFFSLYPQYLQPDMEI